MCLADKGSAKKTRLLGRSCPESPADTMSDSETAGRNPDRKLSVKYLQFRAHNSPERRTGRIAELIMADSIPDHRGSGMSKCS